MVPIYKTSEEAFAAATNALKGILVKLVRNAKDVLN